MAAKRIRLCPNEAIESLIASSAKFRHDPGADASSQAATIQGALLRFAGKIALGEQNFEQLMVDFQLGVPFSLIGERDVISAGEACRRRQKQFHQIRTAIETAKALCEVRVSEGLIVHRMDL